MIELVILGAGNVAKHLYTAFKQAPNIRVRQLYSRNKTDWTRFLGESSTVTVTDDWTSLANADLYLLAVSDAAVAELSRQLPFTGCLVAHTSGNLPLAVGSDRNRRAVFYPLQTFSKDRPLQYSQIPFCLEAESEPDFQLLETLAAALSAPSYRLSSGQRQPLHLAAVFANNFTNHLYHLAAEICQSHQLPFRLLQPLICETAQKIASISPYQAQTGPARRNDRQTLAAHQKQLQDETQRQLYQHLTDSILKTYEIHEL